MRKIRLSITMICVLSLSGCNLSQQNSSIKSEPGWTSNITVDDFMRQRLISQQAINNNNQFIPEDANGQVKITGTEKILIVEQEHLDATPDDLPEHLYILWVLRESGSNDDVVFRGEILQVEKSLIAEIKQAITSQSFEITQAAIDAKKVNNFFQNNSFQFTFHRSDNGYWQPGTTDEYDFDTNRQVAVEGSDYKLLALSRDLDAAAESLPDQVRVQLSKTSPLSSLPDFEANAELFMVPKSVISDMKTALSSDPQGSVTRNTETWIHLVSFHLRASIVLSSANEQKSMTFHFK